MIRFIFSVIFVCIFSSSIAFSIGKQFINLNVCSGSDLYVGYNPVPQKEHAEFQELIKESLGLSSEKITKKEFPHIEFKSFSGEASKKLSAELLTDLADILDVKKNNSSGETAQAELIEIPLNKSNLDVIEKKLRDTSKEIIKEDDEAKIRNNKIALTSSVWLAGSQIIVALGGAANPGLYVIYGLAGMALCAHSICSNTRNLPSFTKFKNLYEDLKVQNFEESNPEQMKIGWVKTDSYAEDDSGRQVRTITGFFFIPFFHSSSQTVRYRFFAAGRSELLFEDSK